jgi:hypothetical protein
MVFDIMQALRSQLGFILAYFISVTISGAIKAWLAKRAGDYTADHAGYLTLDPLVHVDPFGLISLLLVGFGWGAEVPVSIANISAPYRDLKILAVYYVQTIIHILFTALAILLLATIQLSQLINLHQTVSVSTLIIILSAFMTTNIFLAMLRFIQSSIDLICTHLVERDPASIIYIHLGSLLVAMALLLFFGQQIQMFFANVSSMLAMFVLRLFA